MEENAPTPLVATSVDVLWDTTRLWMDHDALVSFRLKCVWMCDETAQRINNFSYVGYRHVY